MGMKLLDLVHRQPIPEPWAEGEKIPWSDPEFSSRMLKEHLSQEHDAASRRFEVVDRHVGWIHHEVLSGHPTRILDLGCGPGLYTSRLSKLGHECSGIDFSPASIAYAREQAERERLQCTYLLEDIRTADYGTGYGLVMLVFGEFNVFSPSDAMVILCKARGALTEGGILLLEPHTPSAVREVGQRASSWYSAERGLFSDRPHICLEESFWDAGRCASTERYLIIDALTGEVERHASSMRAYTNEQYRALLAECGLGDIEFHPSLTGGVDGSQGGLIVLTAQRRERTCRWFHSGPRVTA
jgi:SAM-dependent methyltransferase